MLIQTLRVRVEIIVTLLFNVAEVNISSGYTMNCQGLVPRDHPVYRLAIPGGH